MAGRNPYQGGGKPKIPRRLLEFDDLYQAVQNLLYGFQNTKDIMILLPEERTDVQGRTLPDPVPNGVWAWNHDASAPRYFTPEQFYAEMPVSLHLDQLQDLHAQTLALRNQAQGFRDSALLFANDSTVSAGLSSGFASQAQGFANGAASSKLDADEAAIQAAGSASASQEHANSSQSSAQTAGTHATSAQTNANKAQAWASNPVGVPVEANLYSARHYAQEAANAATGSMRFKGIWDASVGSYPDAPATGDFYRISVAGTISGRELNPSDQIFFDGAGWDHIDNTDRVMSVNGQTGNVQLTSEQIAGFGSLAAKDQVDWTTDLINIPDLAPLSHTHNKGEVGLSNVDNTSDMAKPVSTATATALAGKANTTHTHSISNVTGLQTALNGKQAAGSYAAASHTHTIANVSGLQGALDAKANSTNPSISGQIIQSSADDAWVVQSADRGGLWRTSQGVMLVNFLGGRWDTLSLDSSGHAHTRHGQLAYINNPSFTGTVSASGTVACGLLTVNGPAPGTQEAHLAFRRGGIVHWQMGTEAGREFSIWAYNDSGGYIRRALGINRDGHISGRSFTPENSNGSGIGGNGDGLEISANFYIRGNGFLLNGTSNGWVRMPRVFVQAGDPGGAAADGDLWIW